MNETIFGSVSGRPTTSLLALMTCAALVACTVEVDDAFPETQELRSGPALPALPASMTSSLAALQAAAAAGNAFHPQRLVEVAGDYAARYEGVPRSADPLGVTFLTDADGKVTAISVTYARVPDLTRPTAAELGAWIDAESAAIGNVLLDGDGALPLKRIARLRTPTEYVNVILGASPRQPRLLSLTRGLPIQVYEQLGRRRIAIELGVPLQNVSVGTAFFEATMDRASRLGLRYQVAGKGAHLYLVPDGGNPLGTVVSSSAFAPVRSQARERYRQALAMKLQQPTNTSLGSLLERAHARQWGRTFALADALLGTARAYPCPTCSAYSAAEFDLGNLDFTEHLVDGPGLGRSCTCTERYQGGAEVDVPNCDNMDCCELVDGEYPEGGNCLLSCTCECDQMIWETVHYDHLLRGVPNLYQQEVDVPATPFCGDTVAVGCGAIAAAELAVWYDKLGHDGLLDHHHDTNGLFLWQDLSEELRNDYLDSHCWSQVTWTTQADLAAGIFDYFWDAGVATAVVHDVVEVADESSAWLTIENEIENNRPLVLGLNASTGAALGQGWINHYALITGHSTTVGTRDIHLNMGWGIGSTEILEWDLVGQVHLYTVEVADTPTGNEECMVDTPVEDLFAEDPDLIDWSAISWVYDAYPVVENLTGSSPIDCDRIGGVTDGWFDSHWIETSQCLNPNDVAIIDQQFEQFNEQLNEGMILDWIWE